MSINWSISASLETLKLPLQVPPSLKCILTTLINPSDDFPTYSIYFVAEIRPSEHATVYFTQKTPTVRRPDDYVMKDLCNYQDTRYSLETVQKRQDCQLQALERNRMFSPDIYVGLAKIRHVDPRNSWICIEEILEYPTSDMLEQHADYALIMQRLPEERSLVTLLEKENSVNIQQHVHLLTRHIAHMHRELLASPQQEESTAWGKYDQLKEKLSQNLELLQLVPQPRKDGLDYSHLQEKVTALSDSLQSFFKQHHFQEAFDNRVQKHYIRLCHGDLKVPHIWIMPYNGPECCSTEPGRCIKILDAIDFNPLFCNIDILSDFAMLVTDIHTRTGSAELADEMIAEYLLNTNQDEPEARLVLGFYLIEKALVGAAISILFDNLPILGMRHLAVAELRLQALVKIQQESLTTV